MDCHQLRNWDHHSLRSKWANCEGFCLGQTDLHYSRETSHAAWYAYAMRSRAPYKEKFDQWSVKAWKLWKLIAILSKFQGYELRTIWPPPKVFGNGQNGHAGLEPRQETSRGKGKLCDIVSLRSHWVVTHYKLNCPLLALEHHRGIFWPAWVERPVTRPRGGATNASHLWIVSQPLGFHGGGHN